MIVGWFSNKILNLGPGSPGYTAKVLAELYNELHGASDSKEDTLTILAGRRVMSWQKGGITPKKIPGMTIPDLVEICDEDLATLTFILMYLESVTFRNSVTAHEKTFNATTKVIHENILEIAPAALGKSLSEFQKTAKNFSNGIYPKKETNLKSNTSSFTDKKNEEYSIDISYYSPDIHVQFLSDNSKNSKYTTNFFASFSIEEFRNLNGVDTISVLSKPNKKSYFVTDQGHLGLVEKNLGLEFPEGEQKLPNDSKLRITSIVYQDIGFLLLEEPTQ